MAGAGPASNDASHVSAPVSRSSRADSSALREASYSKAINSRASKSSGFELEDGGGHLGSEARAEETETGHWQHQQQGLLQAVSVRQATGAKIRLWLGLSRPGQQTIHLAAAHTHNHGRQGLAWTCRVYIASLGGRQAARRPQKGPAVLDAQQVATCHHGRRGDRKALARPRRELPHPKRHDRAAGASTQEFINRWTRQSLLAACGRCCLRSLLPAVAAPCLPPPSAPCGRRSDQPDV